MLIEEDPSGVDSNDYFLAAQKKLEECGGEFNFKGCSLYLALQSEVCNERRPCPVRVSLYARMGLHSYKVLQGRKFELNRVARYVESLGTAASAYYMTLYATDMERGGGGGPQTCFEIKVSEYQANRFTLMCPIARIQGEAMIQTKKLGFGMDMDTRLPEWPPVKKSLHEVEESEVQYNDDWIRLYVELAVAIDIRTTDLNFKILGVYMDRKDEGLYAKNATFYIVYKDLHEERLGKSSHRVAVVRRSFDEDTGNFCLVGEIRIESL